LNNICSGGTKRPEQKEPKKKSVVSVGNVRVRPALERGKPSTAGILKAYGGCGKFVGVASPAAGGRGERMGGLGGGTGCGKACILTSLGS